MGFRLYKNILIVLGVAFLLSCKTETQTAAHKVYLDEGWRLFSSESVDVDGSIISSPGFDKKLGYPVKVPATVMHGLMQNDLFPDIFAPDVLEKMDKAPYEVPWWYRKEFRIDALSELDFYQLTFEGINYKANVWLNGVKIAGDDLIQGSYGIWNFDITPFLKKGTNLLAVEIIPPVFGEDVHMGFVDWNPTPPDRLMGIWRGVLLSHTGPVSMRHSNVVTKVDKEILQSAEITLSTVLTNHTGQSQNATIVASFDNINIRKEVELQANETREVFLMPEEFGELKMKNPKLWWPNNMGEQHLYDLTFSVQVSEEESDKDSFRFGVREIEDFWNEAGYRGFMVNGQKIMLRSAGWVDDIFLGDPDEKVKAMVKYARHMNLNSLRLEGFWGRNRTIMDMADECGLLLMHGWSAHWEWDSYVGIPHDDYVSIRGEEAEVIHSNNYRDQVLWLRRHPSVAIWTYGSDKLPRPSLEIRLNEIMAQIDTTRPVLSYCGGAMLMGDSDPRRSEISGPTGVKMEGPYDWVPPVYWYIDKRYGGAFGFNTEVGPGPQIPPLPSIKKMLPADHLWPVDDVWLYYSGRNQFENLDRFLDAFNARYGQSDDIETFLLKNQMSSYEAIRPMFEAFAVNKFHSTGVVQWMFNSAWPTLYWQLFDYYLMPNGAFYGTKKAASPVLPVYNYGDQGIYVNNDKLADLRNISLQVKIYDVSSKLLFDRTEKLNIGPNQAKKVMDMPALQQLPSTYFLDLRLMDDHGKMIENNFYWLSTKPDIPDFENTTWYWTPNKQHADFSALNSMPRTEIKYNYSINEGSDEVSFEVEVDNSTDKIAFFIEFMLVDEKTGEPVLPVFWSDNYISLLPGEQRVLTGTADTSRLKDTKELKIVMQGLNF
ncbi:glycosyl hydrolase 2 galactose-binding domain-containing protein [Proteiniphilum sp.]|nr:sugar-binding domain-containing protein [Proteiniphilum sp.]MEA4917989.1 glycoside hydrolase family 2 protein [Proteiniphilum sp.]